MALTPAEKQKAYRERQKKALEAAPDLAARYIKRTFADFLRQEDHDNPNSVFFGQMDVEFHAIGMQLPDFEGEDEIDLITGERFRGPDGSMGSIAKAEEMVKIFRVAAQLLSELINRFKLSEIDARLAEIEQADLSDPVARKQALADVARLTILRERLDRELRHSFRAISVKGD